MDNKILQMTEAIKEKTKTRRRDFHRHAEAAWTEYYTAALVAETLDKLGYQVSVGEEVLLLEAMIGLPAEAEVARTMNCALLQGANPVWVERMRGGKTGVVGVLAFPRSGPTVALRFDMDAIHTVEIENEDHLPCREGFISTNHGVMHACGHDGHMAVGLAVGEILAGLQTCLCGKVKLIFQPAEEGVRGARAMKLKGVVDDVDYFLGMHLGLQLIKTGQLACHVAGFLATSKIDAQFIGTPAHAGTAPEGGRNALLAAATAALNLHAIPRHSQGESRVNVGVMQAGSGRNIIPASALLQLETRGENNTINQFMNQEAVRILQGAAAMYNVQMKLQEVGGAIEGSNTLALANRLREVGQRLNIFEDIIDDCNFGASEDCTYFMEAVQKRGGQAAYILIGADLAAGHHDCQFDFDEGAMEKAVGILCAATAELLAEEC